MTKFKSFTFFQVFALIFWGVMFSLGYKADFIQYGFMSITMIFGSLIAGATSEGGGAVAFPVMTLLFDISPRIARDFSVIIQSFGMTSALFIILKNKIKFAKNVLLIACIAGLLGQLAAHLFLLNKITPIFIKITFTSIWLGFGIVLILAKKLKTNNEDIKVTKKNILILSLYASIGGVVTAFSGSGIDIFTFAVCVLYFGISEKIATPTSVMLMALHSILSFVLINFFQGEIQKEAINYWMVCLPVVIIGAPLGALFIVNKSKNFIINLLLISILLQFIFSWIILDLNWQLKVWSIFVILIALINFKFLMGKLQKN